MKKPAKVKPLRAWAIVDKNGKHWPGMEGYQMHEHKYEADQGCCRDDGERVIPVMIVPIEQKK